MPLNIDPTNLSAMLIGDPVDGAPIVPTEVDGVPVAATLELQSTIGALLLPRMTDGEMRALAPAVDGMAVYNFDHTAVYFHQNGDWGPSGSAGSGTVTSITQGTNIILSPSPITTSGSVSLNPVLTGLTSVTVGTTTINNLGITDTSSNFSITASAPISDINITASTNLLLLVGSAGTGNVGITRGARLALYNDATSQFIGLRAPSSLGASQTYVLPATAPSQNNQVLASTTGGTMSWQSLGTGSVTSITAGSNLAGGVITSVGTISLATTISGLTSVSSTTGVFGNITTTGNNITSSATMTLTSSGNLSLSGTNALVNSNLQLRTGNSLSLFNAANSFATSIAPANVTSSFTYTLPLTSPASNGQILSSTTGGVMSWITAAGTVTSITAGLNLTGGVITSTGTIGLATTLTGLSTINSDIVNAGNVEISGNIIESSGSSLALISGGSPGNLTIGSALGSIVFSNGTGGPVDLDGNILLRFFDAANSNYVGLKTPSSLSASVAYILPALQPTVDGQVLTSTIAGTMSWSTVGAGTVTSIVAGANLTGGTISSSGTIGLSTTLTGITSAVIGGTTYSSSGIAATGAYSIGTSASVIQLAPTTTVDVVSDLQLIFNASTKAIRFFDQTNTNSVTLKSPGTLVQTTNYVFPTDYPAVSGYHLASTTGGVMSWSADTGAPGTSKYLIQTADGSLPNAQVMGSLITGLVKNTTTTGVQSIAVKGTDYYAFDATYALSIANIGGTPNANLFLANTTNAPTTPAGGGVFYVQAGALLFMGSNGTVTTIAPA